MLRVRQNQPLRNASWRSVRTDFDDETTPPAFHGVVYLTKNYGDGITDAHNCCRLS